MAELIIIEVGRSERGLFARLGDLASYVTGSRVAHLPIRSKQSAIGADVSGTLNARVGQAHCEVCHWQSFLQRSE
jgi:hypothetical protein